MEIVILSLQGSRKGENDRRCLKMLVTSLPSPMSRISYAAAIFRLRLERIALFSCCFTNLTGKWLTALIFSGALQTNTVPCSELKWAGLGSFRIAEQGDAWKADSFSFL